MSGHLEDHGEQGTDAFSDQSKSPAASVHRGRGACVPRGESPSHDGLTAPEHDHDWPSMKIENTETY